jgi:hypothetical protein
MAHAGFRVYFIAQVINEDPVKASEVMLSHPTGGEFYFLAAKRGGIKPLKPNPNAHMKKANKPISFQSAPGPRRGALDPPTDDIPDAECNAALGVVFKKLTLQEAAPKRAKVRGES